MPKIQQLSPHIANLIAAGEVVERPASVVKELLENAVDAGAAKVTVEIQDGGMTFLRVTDNGCGMEPQDAKTAFLRHATSKLRTAEDLNGIGTMGFRGEALAAIAAVSRIDLMTKPENAVIGTSLHLEGGQLLSQGEAGCPQGTTIIIRDLFFNTPARMKFMKSDTVEGSRVSAAVQLQALAHPELAITYLKDGKNVFSTPGTGKLRDAVYVVYGRECAALREVDSTWEQYTVTGFVSKPTDARPSRSLQTFFVNDRPVKSKLLVSALEEAYRNQIMVGKFPACVLHLHIPPAFVDVNVHPSKTEVKFLSEKAVFDCVHYGVLAALNKTTDRPEMQFRQNPPAAAPVSPASAAAPIPSVKPAAVPPKPKQDFFQTMSAADFHSFSQQLKDAPKPKPAAAVKAVSEITALRETVIPPRLPDAPPIPKASQTVISEVLFPDITPQPPAPVITELPETPPAQPWHILGELYNSYLLVQQGDDAFLIDKHAAHERILFDKLKACQGPIASQALLTPIPVRLNPNAQAALLTNRVLLEELGFEAEEFGENTVLIRRIPMDLSPEAAAEAAEALAADLLAGKTASADTVRDDILHTVACKAAIKAGWTTTPAELQALAAEVMARDDLKYCPHGRPICISLSKKQLEKQFKRA